MTKIERERNMTGGNILQVLYLFVVYIPGGFMREGKGWRWPWRW